MSTNQFSNHITPLAKSNHTFLGGIFFFIQKILRQNLFFIHCLVNILRYHTAKFYEYSLRIDEYSIRCMTWFALF